MSIFPFFPSRYSENTPFGLNFFHPSKFCFNEQKSTKKNCKTQIVSFLMCFPIACKHIFSVYLFRSRIKCFVALIRQLLAEHNVCLFFIFGVCTIFSPSRLHSKQSVYLCETFSPSLSFSCPLFVTNSMNARCQEREKKAHRIYVLWTNTKTKTGNYVN